MKHPQLANQPASAKIAADRPADRSKAAHAGVIPFQAATLIARRRATPLRMRR